MVSSNYKSYGCSSVKEYFTLVYKGCSRFHRAGWGVEEVGVAGNRWQDAGGRTYGGEQVGGGGVLVEQGGDVWVEATYTVCFVRLMRGFPRWSQGGVL